MKPRAVFEKYKQILAYLFFGVVTTLVNWVVYALCYNGWALPNTISTILAWILSVAVAFLTNKSWVFQSNDWSFKLVWRELWQFSSCRLLTGLLDLLLMFLLVDLWHLPGSLMKILTNILVVILNYIFSKWMIFNKKTE